MRIASTTLLAFAATASAHAVVIDDFSTVNRASSTTNGVLWADIDAGWGSKGQTGLGTNDGDWIIQNGILDQVAKGGSESRAVLLFSIDSLTGTGWTFKLDLLAGEADDIELYLGKDDGNNATDTAFFGHNAEGAPPSSWVSGNSAPFNSWLTAVNVEDYNTLGTLSVELTGIDLSDYDVAAIKISNRLSTIDGPTFIQVDNIELVQVPEPSSVALLGLGGLCVLRRRRNK